LRHSVGLVLQVFQCVAGIFTCAMESASSALQHAPQIHHWLTTITGDKSYPRYETAACSTNAQSKHYAFCTRRL